MSYTKEQTVRLQSFESISYDQAVTLAVEFGVSTQSVISKVKSLEIDYIKKAVPAKRPTVLTKAQLVDLISAQYPVGVDLSGLVGATLAGLNNLYREVSAT